MPSVPAPKPLTVAPLRGAGPTRASRAQPAPKLSFAWLWVLPALGVAYMTANPLPTVAAVSSFALICGLLWRPGLPPVLLFVCLMQWLQGALLVLHADVLGVEVWTLSYARQIEVSTYLTLGWVSMIAVGAFLMQRRIALGDAASVSSTTLSFPRLLAAYGAWTLALPLMSSVAPGQARQVLEAIETLRWALVYAVFAQGWSMRRGRLIVLGILLIEIAVGFLSFFSEFKTPLFLLAIMLGSVGYRPTLRQYLALSTVFAVTLYLGIVWSSIKMDYRDRLSGGQGNNAQMIVVSTDDQVDAFVGLVGTLDAATLQKGAQQLVARLAYVELFAYVLDYVPRVRRHEEGRIWANAIEHVLVPRVLFPDKARLESDTKVAERYTGMLLTTGRATSISIGLPAETYVDFGPIVMFVIPVLIGLLSGAVFRYFVLKREAGVIAQGAAVAMHVNLATVELAPTKFLGGYLALLIIALFFFRFGWPPFSRFVRAQVARA